MLRLRAQTLAALLCGLPTSRCALRADIYRPPLAAAIVGRTRTYALEAFGDDEEPPAASSMADPGAASQAVMGQIGDAAARPEGLVVVDGHAVAYRMHFALQQTGMTTRQGEATHALHGFCTKLLDLHRRWPSHRMVVCFDLPGGSFARNEELPDYKANRPPMPSPLRHQITAMMEACELMGAPALAAEGFEADDLIAACVAAAREYALPEVIVCSADKDLLQLVSEDASDPTVVTAWNDKNKEVVDAQAVVDKHGVRPSQMGDLLALMGDSSDNIPGIPGVGPKLAAQLLAAHGNLEAVISSAASLSKPTKRSTAIAESADMARQARRLVQLDAEAPLERNVVLGAPPGFDADAPGLDGFLDRWELSNVRSSIRKLETGGSTPRRLAERKQQASVANGGGGEAAVHGGDEASARAAPAPSPEVAVAGAAPSEDAAEASASTATVATGASSSSAAQAVQRAWDEALQAEQRATELARDAERAREAAQAARSRALALEQQARAASAPPGDDATAAAARSARPAPGAGLEMDGREGAPKPVSVLAPEVPF